MAEIEGNVLLVDDEEQFLEALSERLETRGLHVKTVKTGQEALEKIEEHQFDAIVLDLALPGIDGIETLKLLKQKQPDLQIIMLSGHGTFQSGIEAMKYGAEDFLEKPIDLNLLLEKIDSAKSKRMLLLEKCIQKEVSEIIKSKNW